MIKNKMTIIKTIALIAIVQLTSGYLMADTTFKVLAHNARPGDGKNKHNPKKKHGESLKGYFYRVYGDKPVLAKKIKFKGPFKLPKVRAFLLACQKENGTVVEKSTSTIHKDKFGAYDDSVMIGSSYLFSAVNHVSLRSQVYCMVGKKALSSQEWISIYLDRDDRDIWPQKLYINYHNCNSADNVSLKPSQYKIHYDDNPDCLADFSSI